MLADETGVVFGGDDVSVDSGVGGAEERVAPWVGRSCDSEDCPSG